MYPARSSRRWLGAPASAGSSRSVGMCMVDQRMVCDSHFRAVLAEARSLSPAQEESRTDYGADYGGVPVSGLASGRPEQMFAAALRVCTTEYEVPSCCAAPTLVSGLLEMPRLALLTPPKLVPIVSVIAGGPAFAPAGTTLSALISAYAPSAWPGPV